MHYILHLLFLFLFIGSPQFVFAQKEEAKPAPTPNPINQNLIKEVPSLADPISEINKLIQAPSFIDLSGINLEISLQEFFKNKISNLKFNSIPSQEGDVRKIIDFDLDHPTLKHVTINHYLQASISEFGSIEVRLELGPEAPYQTIIMEYSNFKVGQAHLFQCTNDKKCVKVLLINKDGIYEEHSSNR